MTLQELIQYLDSNSGYRILDGNPIQTLLGASQGKHREPLIGEILDALARHCGDARETCVVERAQAISAMGPIRLRYMRDDAPAEGLRIVERIIQAIDGAFNDEALRNRQRV